jgi:hypothetical protein
MTDQASFLDTFDRQKEDARTAHLPGTMDEAIPYYRTLIDRHHAATLVSDLLADFMHYGSALHIDFRNCIEVAEMHFEAEIAEARRAS